MSKALRREGGGEEEVGEMRRLMVSLTVRSVEAAAAARAAGRHNWHACANAHLIHHFFFCFCCCCCSFYYYYPSLSLVFPPLSSQRTRHRNSVDTFGPTDTHNDKSKAESKKKLQQKGFFRREKFPAVVLYCTAIVLSCVCIRTLVKVIKTKRYNKRFKIERVTRALALQERQSWDNNNNNNRTHKNSPKVYRRPPFTPWCLYSIVMDGSDRVGRRRRRRSIELSLSSSFRSGRDIFL